MLQFSCVKNMIGVSKIIIFQRTFLTEKKKVKETQNLFSFLFYPKIIAQSSCIQINYIKETLIQPLICSYSSSCIHAVVWDFLHSEIYLVIMVIFLKIIYLKIY
jgi:hypothetical protein